jgi:hypothetical protein
MPPLNLTLCRMKESLSRAVELQGSHECDRECRHFE